MKFSLLPIFYISLTVASAIPTSKSTRGLRVRDNESIDLSISLSCAQDGLDAAVAFKTGGEKIYNKFKGVVHDEVKRDTSSPEVTGALTKRDLAQCVCLVVPVYSKKSYLTTN
jgi:hypothetical protein